MEITKEDLIKFGFRETPNGWTKHLPTVIIETEPIHYVKDLIAKASD